MVIPSGVLNNNNNNNNTNPSESQGMRILNSANNDQAMITMTGFNCASFDYLLNKFQIPFDSHTPHSKDLKAVSLLYVRFDRCILDMLLSHDDLARIKSPSPAEIETFKEIIGARYPHIRDGVFTSDM